MTPNWASRCECGSLRADSSKPCSVCAYQASLAKVPNFVLYTTQESNDLLVKQATIKEIRRLYDNIENNPNQSQNA